MIWVTAYAAAGVFIGFLSGLLGIGGGMVLVPVLAALYDAQGLAPHSSVHLALGTAMASVAFTTMSTVRAHHGLGGVDWSVVRRVAPGMVAGALVATSLSGFVPQHVLAIVFAVIVYGGATQILLGRKPTGARSFPGALATTGIGFAIGVVAGLVSAGGAFLTIPFMLWCGVNMRTAIGTAAALGMPAAIMGTIGYVGSGLHAQGLPPGSIGFVYLPALAAVVLASMMLAPVGARLTHRVPVDTLKRVFAVLLYTLATRMIVSYS